MKRLFAFVLMHNLKAAVHKWKKLAYRKCINLFLVKIVNGKIRNRFSSAGLNFSKFKEYSE